MRASERCRTNDPNDCMNMFIFPNGGKWQVTTILFLKVVFFLLYVTRVASVYMYVEGTRTCIGAIGAIVYRSNVIVLAVFAHPPEVRKSKQVPSMHRS